MGDGERERKGRLRYVWMGKETGDSGVRAMGSEWGRRVKGRLGGICGALCEPPEACTMRRVRQRGGGRGALAAPFPTSPSAAAAVDPRACHFIINLLRLLIAGGVLRLF